MRLSTMKSGLVPLVALLALGAGLAGCSGDDGKDGTAGPAGGTGATGPAGPTGPTGTTGATGATGAGDYMAQVKTENCDYCHNSSAGLVRGGQGHQDVYNTYTDASKLVLDIVDVTSTLVPGTPNTYTVKLDFTVTKDSVPLIDPTKWSSKGFYTSQWDTATTQFINGQITLVQSDSSPSSTPNASAITCDSVTKICSTTTTQVPFDPKTQNGVVFAKVAQDPLNIESKPPGSTSRVTMYDNVGEDLVAYGAAAGYASAANVSGCESCHGVPYMKHGNIKAIVAGGPDFGSCKSCHNDDKVGDHEDWQFMVDAPFKWATAATPTADYSYKAKLMNDVHMSHAMEFAYPQTMANCVACHAGKLALVLDDSQFTAETCKSCHPRQYALQPGPGGTPKSYADPKRAPAMQDIWKENSVDTFSFHPVTMDSPCSTCHDGSAAPSFKQYHSGYNEVIYDPATGQKWGATKKASITSVTKTGDKLTIKLSATDAAMKPQVLISFYAYGTKDYLVACHTTDAAVAPAKPARYEYVVGTNLDADTANDNRLFTEVKTSVAGTWDVTADLAAYVPALSTGLASIPTLISSGKVSKVEVTLLPNLTVKVDGADLAVAAEGAHSAYTITKGDGALTAVPNYFSGTNAIVKEDSCNKCHDTLGTTFHNPSYGSDVQNCRNCHVPTSGGSHLEMQSRSIDSYAHAIHRFQWFDAGCPNGPNKPAEGTTPAVTNCSTDLTDPVVAARYSEHTRAMWPLFTLNACQGCHATGKFEKVLDTNSIPALLSAAYVNKTSTWKRGPQNAMVVGPADKACVSCHRAAAINADNTEALEDLNAHMVGQSYMIDNTSANPSTTSWVYRAIDKIMTALF